jgi:Uncharacterised nucleotidyltransferase
MTPAFMRSALLELPDVTETLAMEFACAGTSEPDWPDWKWGVARGVVTIHGMAGVLAANSAWNRGPGWRDFLHGQQAHIAERQRHVSKLLEAIGQEAIAAGIPVAALKGATLPAFGLAPLGSRPLADLDLLVDAKERAPMVNILRKLGYREAEDGWKHLAFEPARTVPCSEFGEHRDRAIGIDLHFSIRERLAEQIIDITREVATDSAAAGIVIYQSRMSLLRHLLLHAAANIASRWLRGIQLHDIASVVAQFDQRDWNQLLSIGQDSRSRWWSYAPLALTARYWPQAIPTEILGSIAADCGVLHRHMSRAAKLHDVSASNHRLTAFPQLMWSQSPAGALRYCWRRVFPSRETLGSYAHMTNRSDFAAKVEWFGMSQTMRALKWLFDRPPRHATAYMIAGGIKSQCADATSLNNGA